METLDPTLREAAVRVFGSELLAARWLTTPFEALGGKRPVDADLEKVLDLLRRLEHGFSA